MSREKGIKKNIINTEKKKGLGTVCDALKHGNKHDHKLGCTKGKQ